MASLEDVLGKVSLANKNINVVVWSDTDGSGVPIPSDISLKFASKFPEEQAKQVIRSINKTIPVLGIVDGCQFYRCDDIVGFAIKPCEGCEDGKSKSET